jgi:hypothetical protein
MGAQGDSVVAQMEAMGFPRSDIDRAMRAAFYNPDRAIEYLLNVSVGASCLASELKWLTDLPRGSLKLLKNSQSNQPVLLKPELPRLPV